MISFRHNCFHFYYYNYSHCPCRAATGLIINFIPHRRAFLFMAVRHYNFPKQHLYKAKKFLLHTAPFFAVLPLLRKCDWLTVNCNPTPSACLCNRHTNKTGSHKSSEGRWHVFFHASGYPDYFLLSATAICCPGRWAEKQISNCIKENTITKSDKKLDIL